MPGFLSWVAGSRRCLLWSPVNLPGTTGQWKRPASVLFPRRMAALSLAEFVEKKKRRRKGSQKVFSAGRSVPLQSAGAELWASVSPTPSTLLLSFSSYSLLLALHPLLLCYGSLFLILLFYSFSLTFSFVLNLFVPDPCTACFLPVSTIFLFLQPQPMSLCNPTETGSILSFIVVQEFIVCLLVVFTRVLQSSTPAPFPATPTEVYNKTSWGAIAKAS